MMAALTQEQIKRLSEEERERLGYALVTVQVFTPVMNKVPTYWVDGLGWGKPPSRVTVSYVTEYRKKGNL
jgi:hypothetical protein